ncbi:hypothetical protein NMG60_11012515, partial [Bertholletia excelsa]
GSNLEEEEDLISSLDDDTLCQIILLLPFKCVVRTSVLSKRWRPLWNKALSLHGTIEDIPKVVTAFLDSFNKYKQLSNHPRLQYECSQGGTLKVTIEDNKGLHIAFDEENDFPESFDWQLHCQNISNEPTSSHGFSVRALQVKSVSKLTEKPVSSLISNFQLLESLSISECRGLQSLRILIKSKFRSLIISDCPMLNDIFIVACNLQTLRFQGLLPQFSFFYGLASDLKEAVLDYRGGPANSTFSIENFCQFLHAISKVEALTLCGWPFQVSFRAWLLKAGFHQDPEDFMFQRLKELHWIDISMDENRVDVLISFLTICAGLEMLCIAIDPTSYVNLNKEECVLQQYILNEAGNQRQLDHLRIVKLQGFVAHEDGDLFAEYLLKKGVISVLPKIVVNPMSQQKFYGVGGASSSSSGHEKEAVRKNPDIYDYRDDEEDANEY